jgi:hypothetical protein
MTLLGTIGTVYAVFGWSIFPWLLTVTAFTVAFRARARSANRDLSRFVFLVNAQIYGAATIVALVGWVGYLAFV